MKYLQFEHLQRCSVESWMQFMQPPDKKKLHFVRPGAGRQQKAQRSGDHNHIRLQAKQPGAKCNAWKRPAQGNRVQGCWEVLWEQLTAFSRRTGGEFRLNGSVGPRVTLYFKPKQDGKVRKEKRWAWESLLQIDPIKISAVEKKTSLCWFF